MNRRNLKWVTWSFVAVTMIIVALMLFSTLNRPTRITLPPEQAASDPVISDTEEGMNTLGLVEVTPKTVQSAIAALERPESYRRTIMVEQFWSGGSGTYEISVTAGGGWVRTDRTMTDGRMRHTITGYDEVFIWYNNEETIYTGAAGEISADNEKMIPTYEDILALDVSSIVAANHCVISDVSCIYVETAEDQYGYTLRYWVSLDTGLLAAAEKLYEGETVYRMAGLQVEQSAPIAVDFTLPDGTQLIIQ